MATLTKTAAEGLSDLSSSSNAERERVFDAFRRWGYLEADLDPLGFLQPEPHPELQVDGEFAHEARRIYSGTIGVEFAHIADPERRRWIQERMEGSSQPEVDQEHVLDQLIRAELFEQVLQKRYLGSKRYSLEGIAALIPLVDEIIEAASERGAVELVMGMSHRGRLNVIVQVAQRGPEEVFAGFEDVDPRSVLGSGDVKYHMGATGEYETRRGARVHIHLVSNPSHLEAVDPVTVGRTRAKQDRAGEDGRKKYLPLLVHGDAAFAGQGITAETLNLAELKGYSVGGTVHIIANNLLGFTTLYNEEHSSRFSAQLARRQSIPIFHVNAEDVDAVIRVGRMALEYRYAFGSDVVIDLIGYRRHGHSEVDDPTVTQPLLYKSIKAYPEGFHIHPKVKMLLEQRGEMGAGKRAVDYGMAEALAFASLVKASIPVRLSGQDTRRGTFNQRHSVLVDIENEHEHVPLENISEGQARCEIYNSPLSEAGALGFEYGYSRDYPETLVLWEAQFGDFANVAQAVIDQFISAGEDKWNLLSGLVLLLPHGYEGQGPEHSSARIERFLQLAARDNFQICQPSNAAQYFHLLRRQALRHWRKPLVLFTPKSMLRHPDANSPIEDFTHRRFLPVLPDTEVSDARRILICTGKIGHELRMERQRRKDNSTAILFLEQLYPFPEQELADAIQQHASARDIVWVQEEPANMGALFYMLPRLRHISGERAVLSVKRSASASPSTGSAKAHEVEQKTLLTLAFTTKS